MLTPLISLHSTRLHGPFPTPPVCLSVCLSVWLTGWLTVLTSVCLSVCPFSFFLPAWLSDHAQPRLSVHLIACPSACLSVFCLPSACLNSGLSVRSSIRASACMPVYLSVCSFSIFLSAYTAYPTRLYPLSAHMSAWLFVFCLLSCLPTLPVTNTTGKVCRLADKRQKMYKQTDRQTGEQTLRQTDGQKRRA